MNFASSNFHSMVSFKPDGVVSENYSVCTFYTVTCMPKVIITNIVVMINSRSEVTMQIGVATYGPSGSSCWD